MRPLRCAIYTRKSTEDGLEQEFNSLDAQREACEAYILSQRHEGWTLVAGRYDDGGFSGGNMERPGLKALLAEVDAGQVDVIVVYKVDRLTRSLADFAKIVERLDDKHASFVSVTQAFNTTTSMGRLTLNVLLSFAQFEREVTGERIRDKIAASKRKGLWMGGPVPLGYQVIERKLVPVPEEAERVQLIMRRYVASTSADSLIVQLQAEGVVTKIQNRTSGPHRGGIPFRRGSLFHLLKNPIYRGKIVHKGNVYEGEHEPIVDQGLWDEVQDRLSLKAPPRRRSTNDRQSALLSGLLSDLQGRPIVATYTTKGMRRYGYYETRKDLARPSDPPSTRFVQGALNRHIVDQLTNLLSNDHALRHLSGFDDAADLKGLLSAARYLAARLDRPRDIYDVVRSVVDRVKVQKGHLELTLNPEAFEFDDLPCWIWTVPLPARKPYREAYLRIDANIQGDGPSTQLIELLSDASKAQKLVMASPDLSLNQIALREGRCRKQLAKLFRLSFLSPRIVDAIVAGEQPRILSRQRLLEADLPVDWSEQHQLFGLAV